MTSEEIIAEAISSCDDRIDFSRCDGCEEGLLSELIDAGFIIEVEEDEYIWDKTCDGDFEEFMKEFVENNPGCDWNDYEELIFEYAKECADSKEYEKFFEVDEGDAFRDFLENNEYTYIIRYSEMGPYITQWNPQIGAIPKRDQVCEAWERFAERMRMEYFVEEISDDDDEDEYEEDDDDEQ
ncbi:MAG: hypothetical protein LBR22_11550 [Desulfovibrio sp.]|jgi:hypothetical protein|nr:hypothetical protein [Desulfovibrio sp.]